jgi:hypothetical protein
MGPVDVGSQETPSEDKHPSRQTGFGIPLSSPFLSGAFMRQLLLSANIIGDGVGDGGLSKGLVDKGRRLLLGSMRNLIAGGLSECRRSPQSRTPPGFQGG